MLSLPIFDSTVPVRFLYSHVLLLCEIGFWVSFPCYCQTMNCQTMTVIYCQTMTSLSSIVKHDFPVIYCQTMTSLSSIPRLEGHKIYNNQNFCVLVRIWYVSYLGGWRLGYSSTLLNTKLTSLVTTVNFTCPTCWTSEQILF